MNGGTVKVGDKAAFDAWLDRVILDDRSTPTKRDAAAQALECVSAAYIRRAVIEHLEGRRKIRSGIEMRRFRFTGDVHLENLEIGFPLFFLGCVFDGAIYGGGARTKTLGFTNSRMEFGADLRNARVEGHVFLRGAFEANGPILLRDAKIEGTLDLNGGRFLYDGEEPKEPFWRAAQGDCLGLSRTEAAALLWSHAPPEGTASHRPNAADRKPQGLVTLRDMRVRSFRHDMNKRGLAAWPEGEDKSRLVLDGFTYEHITEAPCETFLEWLGLQQTPSPAPYFTLASVLQKQGLKEDAIRIRAQVRRNEVAGYRPIKRFFANLVFWPVDYGASPVRALALMVALLGLYCAAVAALDSTGRMTPAASGLLFNPCHYDSPCGDGSIEWKEAGIAGSAPRYVPPDYPPLSAFQYGLEAFVPVFDFGQHDRWEPVSAGIRLALAVTSLLGLFLGSLFFAAVTGLMRPREA